MWFSEISFSSVQHCALQNSLILTWIGIYAKNMFSIFKIIITENDLLYLLQYLCFPERMIKDQYLCTCILSALTMQILALRFRHNVNRFMSSVNLDLAFLFDLGCCLFDVGWSIALLVHVLLLSSLTLIFVCIRFCISGFSEGYSSCCWRVFFHPTETHWNRYCLNLAFSRMKSHNICTMF